MTVCAARRAALRLLAGCAAMAAARGAWALREPVEEQVRLSQAQSRAFQAWMLRIVNAQIEKGPSPRWTHRDCAGLVRFAVNEALTVHDARWLHANGIASDRRLPPELELEPNQAALRNRWVQTGGTVGHFVTALALVQHNSRFVARDAVRSGHSRCAASRPGRRGFAPATSAPVPRPVRARPTRPVRRPWRCPPPARARRRAA